MITCPSCLEETEPAFQSDGAGAAGYACSGCGESMPIRYVLDYTEYPPAVFSLTGLSGQGKTCYLASLLFELDRVGKEWPAFSYIPLDEEGLQGIRERQRALESGQLPESTRKVFPRPVILRLEGVPEFPRCHLLLYDTAGEAFQRTSEVREYAGYVTHSSVVVFIVSLAEQEAPSPLVDFLTVYIQAATQLGGDPRKQTLLVVISKADRLAARGSLPQPISAFLTGQTDAGAWADMEALSEAIEAWVEDQPGLANFVRRARVEFGSVRYTIVSALGSNPDGPTLSVTPAPRGVLLPLRYVLALEREGAESRAQRAREEQERRARETAEADAEQRELQARALAQAREERRRGLLLAAKRVADALAVAALLAGPALSLYQGWSAARAAAGLKLTAVLMSAYRTGAVMGVLMLPSLILYGLVTGKRWRVAAPVDLTLWALTALLAGGVFLGLVCAIVFGIGYSAGK